MHRERLRLPVVVALLTLVPVALLVLLAAEGWRKVDALASANSDSTQWTLSQIEVEFLKLEEALRLAAEGSDLDEVRRSFDILYNRTDILRTAEVYAESIKAADVGGALEDIWAELVAATPAMDASDQVLREALPSLSERLASLRGSVREVSIGASRSLAGMADRQRGEVMQVLRRLAIATSLFVVILVASVALQVRQNQKIARISLEREATAKRISAIFSTAIDAVIVADRDGRILELNSAAEEMFGHASADVVGRSMSDVMIPDHLRAAHEAGMARYRVDGERRMLGKGRVQTHALRQNGQVFPVELSIDEAEAPGATGGAVFVAFIRDISDRVEAEAELSRSRDDARAGEKAKAGLLAVMSHEMRTPLNGMLGALELLKTFPRAPEVERLVRIMEVSGDILLSHIDDVLEVSRLDANQVKTTVATFDLGQLLTELADLHAPLAAERGNTLHVRYGADVGPVRGDQEKIRQVLINLISNAVKFTHGGDVTVEAERQNGDTIELRVSDTGIGISQEAQKRLFDPFFTVDPTDSRATGGVGLGLAITARLVTLIEGEIVLESTPGSGSVFKVRLSLPTSDEPVAAPRSSSGAAEHATETSTINVLLVEDNAINRRVAHGLLTQEMCTTVLARDGFEAVRLAEGERFDLILMDIGLPGMDGIEAMHLIREHGASKDSRIVALTANAMPDSVRRFLEAGFEAVVTKPVSRRRLANILREGPGIHADDAPSGSKQLLDPSVGAELAEALGKEGVASAWNQFLRQGDALIVRLTEIQAGRSSEPQDEAQIHRLAGTAAVMGATRLSEALLHLEEKLSEAKVHGETAEIREASAAWHATRRALSGGEFSS